MLARAQQIYADWKKELTGAEIFLLSFLFFHLFLGLMIAFINPDYFKNSYTVEDGMIEWYTVDALLFCAALCVYRFFLSLGKKPWTYQVGLFFMGIVFIFGAGAEISWGQRLFNVTSSEFFATHNAQGETNVHNLVVEGKKINKIIFGTGLSLMVAFYFFVLPILARKLGWIQNLVTNFAVPLPRLFHLILYMILGMIVFITPSSKKGELLEFGGCLIFFMLILVPANKENFDFH